MNRLIRFSHHDRSWQVWVRIDFATTGDTVDASRWVNIDADEARAYFDAGAELADTAA